MVRRGPAFVFARKSRSKLVFEDCPDRVRPPPRMPDDDPAAGGYLVLPSADVVSVRIDFVGETLSDADVMTEVFTRGSDVMQAMDHTNPANSRAIAVTTTGVSLPFAIMCR